MNIKEFFQSRKSQISSVVIGLVVGIVLSFVVGALLQMIPKESSGGDKEILEVTKVDTETQKPTKQIVTVEVIDRKLQNISELSTAEMFYTGLLSISEGKIPFLTKKGFSMVYIGSVKAGIDPSQMKVDVEEKDMVVTITIPQAEIQTVKVDPSSIRFYDEKKALFNQDEKTDVTDAIVLAENDLKEMADTDGLLKRANQQAEYIIEGILENSIGDMNLVIKHLN